MKLIFALSFLFIISSNAQVSKEKLDSLFEKFVSFKKGETGGNGQRNMAVTGTPAAKCGFGLASQVRNNFENFTAGQQVILKPLLDRPEKQDSMLSPSGYFWVHYDLTGFEVPDYDNSLTVEENVREVCLALDSVYNYEVGFLGFLPPPPDNNEGGDNRYDVYITTAGGSYGFTQPDVSLGNQKYTSHIEIHNSFGSGFFTHGFEAMKVTVAHEFNHAIQVGNYTGDKTDFDLAFYEITSTSMEEFVFNEVNDYYNYMDHYFFEPGKRLTRSSDNLDGYDLAIWNLFLDKKFDLNIFRRQWELFVDNRALKSIEISIQERESSFGAALNEFGIWTFFTNYRSIPGEYFDEAADYPLVQSVHELNYFSGRMPVTVNAQPASNNFITFINTQFTEDTLVVLVSYTNTNSNTASSFEYILSDDSLQGSTRISENYFTEFNVTDPENWDLTELLYNPLILNYEVVRHFTSTASGFFAFPNPFFFNKFYYDCNCVRFRVDPQNQSRANLHVYTSAMELVYSSELDIVNSLIGPVIRWEDIRNQNLATGVYIYVTKIGDNINKGKLVIFNE